MRKYIGFFKMRFSTGLQYRGAYISAIVTQLPWALMECYAYMALHESNPRHFPMALTAVTSYIWLKEAFFALFNVWIGTDNDIFDMIVDGGISYELCRPLSVYHMWFARVAGGRISSALIRCIPIMLIGFLVPKPYGLSLPASFLSLSLFILAMVLGLGVTVAFCMVVYMICFFTISPKGIRMVLTGAIELFSGAIIPLPLIPYPYRSIFEMLPFGSMMNVPFRIYTGDLYGSDMIFAIALQIFWLVALVGLGHVLYRLTERRIVIQGG